MTTKIAGYQNSARKAEVEELLESNALFAESFAAASAALLSMQQEDQGWAPLNRMNEDDGFKLESLHEIAEHAELQTTGNPLLKRGLTLRTSNVFGRGIFFKAKNTVPPRYQKILDKPINDAVLFCEQAYDNNERELFTKGTLIMAYRRSTESFFPIPFAEVTNSASNPDLAQDVWFYQRSYTKIDLTTGEPEKEPTVEWYPVLEKYEEGVDKLPPTLKDNTGNQPVVSDVVIIDLKVNTSIGSVWGVPDCLPAMPYAWAHAEYIRDASKLLKALSTIAWKVVAKSKSNMNTAAGKVAAPKVAGSTATMTAGTDMVSVPRAGQVDMKDGQAIAGYVASALEVSLIALLSDPGTASGSYGAAATLDAPSANSARARQALWIKFYKRIYRAIGLKDIEVSFPKIAEDPIYRTGQMLQAGFASGAIHQDEYRAAFLKLTDVVAIHPESEVPEANVFTTAAKFSIEAQKIEQEAADRESEAAAAAAVSGQGQGDGIGASAGNNDLRDRETKAGTGSA